MDLSWTNMKSLEQFHLTLTRLFAKLAVKNGGLEYPHYTKGSCEMYPLRGNKPHAVLFDGADCVWYENENFSH
ncbi:MAG: hypothetical protein PHV56_05715 [Clostridia bacterium]|nr:hypothetical protein [Clostridia bacterium]